MNRSDTLKSIGIHDPSFAFTTVRELVDGGLIFPPLDGNHGEIHPTAEDYVRDGIPFIMASDIFGGRVDFLGCKFIAQRQAETLRKGFAKNGDVLLTHKATIGRSAIVNYPNAPYVMLTPQVTYYRIRDPRQLSNIYLKCYFECAFFQRLLHLWAGSGATRAYLGITEQAKLPVVVPPIEVQRKIAAILSAYDDLIANNQRRITLLARMAEEIYREWFVRLRFPGYEQIKIEKGTPKSWKESSLGTIADFTMGQSPSSEYFNEVGIGLPFHQGVGSYGPRYPNHDTFCSVPGRMARPGDVLFSVRAPVGRLNVADRELIIGRGLSAIRHKSGLNTYLFYLLKVMFATEDIIGNGSIFNSVGKDELARVAIFDPGSDLVHRFEALVRPIDQSIAALFCTTDNLKRARNALLPRLISGKLAVDKLDIHFPPATAKAG